MQTLSALTIQLLEGQCNQSSPPAPTARLPEQPHTSPTLLPNCSCPSRSWGGPCLPPHHTAPQPSQGSCPSPLATASPSTAHSATFPPGFYSLRGGVGGVSNMSSVCPHWPRYPPHTLPALPLPPLLTELKVGITNFSRLVATTILHLAIRA